MLVPVGERVDAAELELVAEPDCDPDADEVADADTVTPAVGKFFQEEPAAADAANAAGTSWLDGLDELFEAILEASRRKHLQGRPASGVGR